jgi:hypothetical protein
VLLEIQVVHLDPFYLETRRMTATNSKYLQNDLIRFGCIFFFLVLITPIIHYQMHELGLAASLRTYDFKLSIKGFYFYLFGIVLLIPYMILYRIVHFLFQQKLNQNHVYQQCFLKFVGNFLISIFFSFAFPIFLVLAESWLADSYSTTDRGVEFNGNLVYIFRNPVTLFFYYLVASTVLSSPGVSLKQEKEKKGPDTISRS